MSEGPLACLDGTEGSGSLSRCDEGTGKEAVLVYDGECGFCTSAVHLAERLAGGPYRTVAWQQADLDGLGLSYDKCRRAVQWVGAAGEQAEGAAAVGALLRASARPALRALGRLLAVASVAPAAERAYRFVAANRHRLPGSASRAKGARRAGTALVAEPHERPEPRPGAPSWGYGADRDDGSGPRWRQR